MWHSHDRGDRACDIHMTGEIGHTVVSEEKAHKDKFPPAEVLVATLFTVVHWLFVCQEPCKDRDERSTA